MRPHSRLPARHRCLSSYSRAPGRVRSARSCAVPDRARSVPAAVVCRIEPHRPLTAATAGLLQGGESVMPTPGFDINELKRRMQGATQSLKHELGGLRPGRAAASMLEPVQVEAYGSHMPLNQLATVNVPETRLLSLHVLDKSLVKGVGKASG